LKNNNQDSLRCPVCTEVSTDPPKINFAVAEIVSEIPKKKSMEEKKCDDDSKACDECRVKHLNWYCSSCGCYYCNECNTSIHALRAFCEHDRVERKNRQIIYNARCLIHTDYPLDLYCKSCEEGICLYCHTHGAHLHHDAVRLTDLSKVVLAQVQTEMADAKSKATVTEHYKAKLEAALGQSPSYSNRGEIQTVANSLDVAKHAIDAHFARIIQEAEANRNYLTFCAQRVAESKTDELRKNVENVNNALQQFQSGWDSAENIFSMSNYEICCKYWPILKRAQQVSSFPADWPLLDFGDKLDAFVRFQLNTDEVLAAINGSVIGGPLSDGIRLEHVSDFDTNGVLYFIATAGGSRTYVNPCKSGAVSVECSSYYPNKGMRSCFVGRQGAYFRTEERRGGYTDENAGNWMMVDLGEGRLLVPSFYSLRHGRDCKLFCLRNWELQGCIDPDTRQDKWVTLREHTNDTSLNEAFATCSWEVTPDPQHQQQAFRCFRIIMTGPDSQQKHYLHCSGIELYGVLKM